KHLHIETANIRHFSLIINDIGLESLVKYPDCSLNETQSSEISINYPKVLSIKYLFQFNDIIIESSVRHFIIAVTAVSNIIDLHKNDDLKSLTRQQ
ncbi:10804_t:CDS:2, partial [Funneliformis geosporum]